MVSVCMYERMCVCCRLYDNVILLGVVVGCALCALIRNTNDANSYVVCNQSIAKKNVAFLLSLMYLSMARLTCCIHQPMGT